MALDNDLSFVTSQYDSASEDGKFQVKKEDNKTTDKPIPQHIQKL